MTLPSIFSVISFWRWFKQLICFLLAWSFVKTTVGLALYFIPLFNIFATWILTPFASSEEAQIIFVMFIFPLCMNIVQAWLIDKVIKGKVSAPYSALGDYSYRVENNIHSEIDIDQQDTSLVESSRSFQIPSDYEAE